MLKHLLFIISVISLQALNAKDYSKVVLQTPIGTYITSDQQHEGLLNCNAEQIFEWETFQLHQKDEVKFILKDYYGHNIFINKNGELVYGQSSPEIFTVKNKDKRSYLVSTSSGKYLHCKNGQLKLSKDLSESIIIHKIDERNIFNGAIKNSGLVLILLAIIAYLVLFFLEWKKLKLKEQYTFLIIFSANLLIGFFAAYQTDFLGEWDEQYHALVGKNLSKTPLVPRLYNLSSFADNLKWLKANIWLHKQPLFLYQIAVSVLLFGQNIIAVRLPSIILLAVLGFGVYRVGKITYNKKIGLFSSWLFLLLGYKHLILMGLRATDHNDLIFMVYIFFSIWFYIEYLNRPKKLYLLYLVGLFSGFAVLTKWLVGLLVYLFIFFHKAISTRERGVLLFKNYFNLISKPFLISLVFVISWQLYIHLRFPIIAAHESKLVSAHFFEVIENHGGNWTFHFNRMVEHYGISFSLIFGLAFFSFFSKNQNPISKAMLLSVISVLLFYTAAATKMDAFTFILAPILMLIFTNGLSSIHDFLLEKSKLFVSNAITLIFAALLSYHIFNLTIIQELFLTNRDTKQFLISKSLVTKKIQSTKIENTERTILFNCQGQNEILAMFFLNVAQAVSHIPSMEEVEATLSKGYKIAIYNSPNLPNHLKNRENITILPNY